MKFIKVQWSGHSEEEATWELKTEMKKNFSSFFDTVIHEELEM